MSSARERKQAKWKLNLFRFTIQCVSVDSTSFVIYPELEATEVRFSALKQYLCSFYFRIDNETGGIQWNTLHILLVLVKGKVKERAIKRWLQWKFHFAQIYLSICLSIVQCTCIYYSSLPSIRTVTIFSDLVNFWTHQCYSLVRAIDGWKSLCETAKDNNDILCTT